MRRLALLPALAFGACAAASPERLPTPRPRQFVARPRIEVATIAPETSRRRLWPLTELPSLQPHHDFAMAPDLCTAEWAARHMQRAELVAYGAAWCRIRSGQNGVPALAKLAKGPVDDVQRAARLDVVNLLAGDDASLALLSLQRLGLETAENLDLLAATYDALDMREEALRIAERVWHVDTDVSAVEYCERVLGWFELDEKPLRIFDYRSASNAPCGKRAEAVMCAVEVASRHRDTSALAAARECYNEFPDDENAERRVWLLVAFFDWPAQRTRFGWLALSREAEHAIGLEGAEDLAIAALENAIRASSCEPALLREVAKASDRIASLDQHHAQYQARLDALRTMTDKRCVELHE